MNPSKILDSDVNTFGRRADMFRYVLEGVSISYDLVLVYII